jgi:hypothetical protein
MPHAASTAYMNFKTASIYYQQLLLQSGERTVFVTVHFIQTVHTCLISHKDGKDLHRTSEDQNMWGGLFPLGTVKCKYGERLCLFNTSATDRFIKTDSNEQYIHTYTL